MQVKEHCWMVTTPYDGATEDMFASRTRIRNEFSNLCGSDFKKIKWASGSSTPSNWLGYDANTPSPGYRIDVHYWYVFDDDACKFMLACGTHIREMAGC
jgi:hypothetical protein